MFATSLQSLPLDHDIFRVIGTWLNFSEPCFFPPRKLDNTTMFSGCGYLMRKCVQSAKVQSPSHYDPPKVVTQSLIGCN